MIDRLRIYTHLVCIRVLETGEITPENHESLANRYNALADAEERCRKRVAAARHRALAKKHAMLGPSDDGGPYAAALAMGEPPRPIFTDARAVKLFKE